MIKTLRTNTATWREMQLKPINALALKFVDMRAEKYKDSIYYTI